jgi:hypothetical protein
VSNASGYTHANVRDALDARPAVIDGVDLLNSHEPQKQFVVSVEHAAPANPHEQSAHAQRLYDLAWALCLAGIDDGRGARWVYEL